MDVMEQTILAQLPIRQVIVEDATLRKLWTWALAADSEVSAMGEVEINNGVLHVLPEVHLLKQEGSWGSTHLDMDALSDLMHDHVQQGKGTNVLRFWWHTHPNMGAFFSFTDDETIEKLSKLMPTVIAGVFNTDGETMWRLVTQGVVSDWKHKIPGKKPSHAEQREVKDLIAKFVSKRRWFGFGGDSHRTVWDKCEPEHCKWAPKHFGCDSGGHEPKDHKHFQKIKRTVNADADGGVYE